jgi:acetyl esterase/lipase
MSRAILDLPAPPADYRLAYGPGALHFGDLRLPAGTGPHPVLIAIHGGFWRNSYSMEYMGHLCAALADRGAATWNVEYRRVGDEGGAWPGTLLDVAQAADHLQQLAPSYNLDLRRVVALGHSAGGHLALWLAARPRIALSSPLYSPAPLPLNAAVSLAGVIDLSRAWELNLSDGAVLELLGSTPTEQPERYAAAAPQALLPLGARQLIVHGSDDESVPLALSQSYYEAAHAAGDDARMLILPGAGHFEPVDPRSREWPLVAEAVIELAG